MNKDNFFSKIEKNKQYSPNVRGYSLQEYKNLRIADELTDSEKEEKSRNAFRITELLKQWVTELEESLDEETNSVLGIKIESDYGTGKAIIWDSNDNTTTFYW